MIKCPLCEETYKELEDLYLHVDKKHGELIPEGYTSSRYLYYLKTKREHGNCVICKKPTQWNDQTNKYHRFCTNPVCKEKYRDIFKERMIGKHGKISLLDDPEHQKKMLANRSISGTYKWSDGGETTYTGSYELDFLKMLDNLLDFEAVDIMAPSPHTYWYVHEGVRRFYIPDFFIPSLNLEVEIKDGGDNPNMHHKIQDVDKVKEKLKDDVMKSQDKFSYIKVVNKQYGTFFTFLNKAKKNFANGFKEKPIFLLENVANMAPIVSNLTNKVEYEGEEIEEVEEATKYNEEDLRDHHGVATVITDDQGRILMMDHIKHNLWTIPIGKVKPHQTIEEGLFEEMREELDIVPTDFKEIFSTERFYNRDGKQVKVNQHVFHISKYKGKVKNNEPHKHRSIKWMTLEEINSMHKLSNATSDYMKYTNGEPVAEGTMPISDNGTSLVPVFVLLTYTDSLMAKAIKYVTHQPYSHAGISLDSTMQSIFTYGRKEPKDPCRFTNENIFTGALGQAKDRVKYSLYVTFFEKRQIMTLQERIDNIKKDVSKHGYSYRGLINFALGRETNDDHRMFCSQFVADVIKAGDPERIKKHASRYSPTDLAKVKGMHFITKGILGNYDKKKVDEMVKRIQASLTPQNLINPVIESTMIVEESIGDIICRCVNCNAAIGMGDDREHPGICYRCGKPYRTKREHLVDVAESGTMLDFVTELNNVEDVDRLMVTLESIDDLSYINKVRDRIKALESVQHDETDKCLYIIIESTVQRLMNNRLNIFNPNDSETTIYAVEECRTGSNVDFNVDKYRRKGMKLVQEQCENEIPYDEDKVYVSYKVDCDEPKVIESIRENFSNVQAWKPFAPLTTLNLADEVVMESYGSSLLESIQVDMDAVEIKRYK